MLQLFKSKGKTPSLWIHTRSADSHIRGQTSEAISMANMPLVSHTSTTAILADNGPNLHTAQATMPSGSAPPARKSLNFDNATAPPTDTATAGAEQIIVHDTVVQTATEQSLHPQSSAASAAGAAGTSLQTWQFVKHPNTVKQ